MKTKAETKAADKPAQRSAIQRQPELPGKPGGSASAAPLATTALPPPTDRPAAARAAMVMRAPEQRSAAQSRARIMQSMQRSVGNARVSRMLSVPLQAKLAVGAPNDIYEQEADRVAGQVADQTASSGESSVQRSAEHAAVVRRQPQGGESDAGVEPAVETSIEQARGAGQSLPRGVRHRFEQAMGADFSGVRVHSDTRSDVLNRSLSARAFTTGRDVFFKRGEYNPDSAEGRQLLTHELTHVVQQTGTAQSTAPASPAIQRVALTDKDYAALAEQLHQAMAGLSTDEEAIYVALQKLEKDATAIAKIKQVYKDKYGKDLEAEIRSEMSEEELRLALDLIGIQAEPKKGDMVGNVPATDDEFKAAARKLYTAMQGLGTDEEAIFAVLIPFKRDAGKLTKLKDTYKTEFSGGLTGKGLEEDIKDEMSGDELAYALYLLNAPPPAAPRSTATVSAPGAEAHKGKVAGGEVSVHTGTQYAPAAGGATRPAGFSIGYEGALAAETRWLQFVWREIIVTHPTKGEYRVNSAITTTGGSYNLTTDPDKPNYNTDSADPNSPFYETAGFANRTADATTLFDFPGSMRGLVKTEFDGGATKVVSRAHFNTYLIRDYRTLYHVYLQVEWPFTGPAEPPRTQTVKSAVPADQLPAGMKKRLVEQYPAYAYVQ